MSCRWLTDGGIWVWVGGFIRRGAGGLVFAVIVIDCFYVFTFW